MEYDLPGPHGMMDDSEDRRGPANARATVPPGGGRPDVAGWPVRTLVDAADVGPARGLVAGAGGQPRYLAVDRADGRSPLLVPVGLARADAVRRAVWLPGLSAAALESLPQLTSTPLQRAEEEALLEAFTFLLTGRDAAAVPGTGRPLTPLSRLAGMRVAPGDPDPRGWPVTDGRERLARVTDLLVDHEAGRARFLVCEPLEAGDGSAVALPVDAARIRPSTGSVAVPGLTRAALDRLPKWEGSGEGRLAEPPGTWRPHPPGEAFYDDPRFELDDFYGPPPG